jgi:hypothetical protein
MKQNIKKKLLNLIDEQFAILFLVWTVGITVAAFLLEGWIGMILLSLGVLPWLIMPLYLSNSD